MAYQTGTASNAANLISALKTFAGNNGWTVSGDVIYKGSVYASVDTTAGKPLSEVSIQGGTGESAGVLTGGHANHLSVINDKQALGNLGGAYPVTYYLFSFTNPDQILLFINYNTHYYQWLTFGVLNKCGTYTGGEFYATGFPLSDTYTDHCKMQSGLSKDTYDMACVGLFWGGMMSYTSWSKTDGSSLHLEIDGETWASSAMESLNPLRVNSTGFMYPLVQRANLNSNGSSVMLPYYLWALRDADKASYLGNIPHLRILRIDNYDPGDIITLGADKWKVFPWLKKTADENASNASGPWGVAVKYDGP